MPDLKAPRWMYLKAVLLMVIGSTCATLIFLESPLLRTALFLALTIWAFCRAYYFAFYVVERYIDPSFKFSGLLSLATYLLRKR